MKSFFFRLGFYLQLHPTWSLLPIYLVWYCISTILNLHHISFHVAERRFPGESLINFLLLVFFYFLILINSLGIFKLLRCLLSAVDSLWIFILIHFTFLLFIPNDVFVFILGTIVIGIIVNVFLLSNNVKRSLDSSSAAIFSFLILVFLTSKIEINNAPYLTKCILMSAVGILSTIFFLRKEFFLVIKNHRLINRTTTLKFLWCFLLSSVLSSLIFGLNFFMSLSITFYITLTIQLFYYKRYRKLNWF